MNKVYNHRVDSITIHLHRMLEFLQADGKPKYELLEQPHLRALKCDVPNPKESPPHKRYQVQSAQNGSVYSGLVDYCDDAEHPSLLISQRLEEYRSMLERDGVLRTIVHTHECVLDTKSSTLVQSVGARRIGTPPHGYTYHRDLRSDELVYRFNPEERTGRVFHGENHHAHDLSINRHGAYINYVGGCEEIPMRDALRYIGAERVAFRQDAQSSAASIYGIHGGRRELMLGSRIDLQKMLEDVLLKKRLIHKSYIHSGSAQGQVFPS
jgi:hypothetical protein